MATLPACIGPAPLSPEESAGLRRLCESGVVVGWEIPEGDTLADVLMSLTRADLARVGRDRVYGGTLWMPTEAGRAADRCAL